MIRTLLRRAAVALQRAIDARSVDHQLHYAEEARRAFEAARQSAAWLARRDDDDDDDDDELPGRDVIARAQALAARELAEFEAQLRALEDRIARTPH